MIFPPSRRRRLSRIGLWPAIVFLLLNPLALEAGESPAVRDDKAALAAVIAGNHRSTQDRERDRYRHPLDTLVWFGIHQRMTVVEVWPGGGWYTDILAPFLRDQGRYYAAVAGSSKAFKEKIAAKPPLNGGVVITELNPPHRMTIAPENSADMVVTFRNVHNWMDAGYAAEVFIAMKRALKPGGILGLVEHRGRATAAQDPRARSGYVTEAYVIELAQNAGLRLIGRSEINANPEDTKDYPKGVWTLPPTLILGETDREKYLAIGESDRMTLKFLRPVDPLSNTR